MKFIMFTKHLQGLEVPEIMEALKSVGVEGADLARKLLEAFGPACGQNQVCSAASVLERHRCADAGRSAGDEHDGVGR